MANVLWLQGGACSGNTMSFLNAEEPSACDLVTDFGIKVLWQPSLGVELGDNVQKLLRDCVSGAIPLDIFVFEDCRFHRMRLQGECVIGPRQPRS